MTKYAVLLVALAACASTADPPSSTTQSSVVVTEGQAFDETILAGCQRAIDCGASVTVADCFDAVTAKVGPEVKRDELTCTRAQLNACVSATHAVACAAVHAGHGIPDDCRVCLP